MTSQDGKPRASGAVRVGHGLSAATLVARTVEALAALAGHEGGLFHWRRARRGRGGSTHQFTSISPTRMHDWATSRERDGSWALARVGRYLRDGTLRQHAARWELGGKLDYRLTNVFGAALLLAGTEATTRESLRPAR